MADNKSRVRRSRTSSHKASSNRNRIQNRTKYRSERHPRKMKKGRIKNFLKWMVFFFLLAILAVCIWFYQAYGQRILEYQAEAKRLVYQTDKSIFSSSLTSLVYDADGGLISTLRGAKDAFYLDIEDIPEDAVQAMISIEDKKFLLHSGVDYLANIRAAIELIKHKGEVTQGASTITQQLARNIFLTHEVSVERKLKEIFIALELEKRYSKSDIMEFYLNNIYFSNGYYGIQAASNGYFSKSVKELSLSEIAFLCAIPNNPTDYDPFIHMDHTLERRNRILKQMSEDGVIEEEQYNEALKSKIKLNHYHTERQNYVETYVYHCAILSLMEQSGFEFLDKFASDEEKNEYQDRYYEAYHFYQSSLYTAGYRIYTSIDSKLQKQLQEALDDRLKEFTELSEDGIYTLQGAAVCINNTNGRVAAIVGGRSQEYEGYTLNRAYQSYRQPGSAIKPLIVYTPALERGYDPATLVLDEKFEGGPKNSGNSYEGEVTLQRAVEKSINTVAWKLFKEITPNVGLSYLKKMKFQRIVDTDYVPAAALGGLTYGVSPIEMAAGYAAIENNGYYRDPSCIISIMDYEGKEIVGVSSKGARVYTEAAAKVMTEMLESVMVKGTGSKLGLKGISCAGKTGTTDKKKDGWFAGYTPYYTTSVWVGYDMPKELDDLAGATYPGQIWNQFMQQIHTKDMTEKFEHYDWKAVREALEDEGMNEVSSEGNTESKMESGIQDISLEKDNENKPEDITIDIDTMEDGNQYKVENESEEVRDIVPVDGIMEGVTVSD